MCTTPNKYFPFRKGVRLMKLNNAYDLQIFEHKRRNYIKFQQHEAAMWWMLFDVIIQIWSCCYIYSILKPLHWSRIYPTFAFTHCCQSQSNILILGPSPWEWLWHYLSTTLISGCDMSRAGLDRYQNLRTGIFWTAFNEPNYILHILRFHLQQVISFFNPSTLIF